MKGSEKEHQREILEEKLMEFHAEQFALLGLVPVENRLAFVAQMIDSLQRVEYVQKIGMRPISPARSDPKSALFDPIKAAVLLSPTDREEASWLVFLATHCGRNLRTAWLLARELYGAYESLQWTWSRVFSDPQQYGDWLDDKYLTFSGKFGNHRKYESLRPGISGTAAVVASYVEWVAEHGSHHQLFAKAVDYANKDGRTAFALLYQQMEVVKRFGRTGRFDYLTMIGKAGLAPIEANSTYLIDATGPKRGAKLLFDGDINSLSGANTLESRVNALEGYLGVGMQVMEDAMCNWQKSPNTYVAFRG